MMTIKEQFISEIKERIALQKDLLKRAEDSARIEGSIDALQGLLNSMDTLSKENPINQDELEKEIGEYMSNEDNNPFDWDWRDKRDCARHFAQWGAEHLANSNDEVVINGHKVEYDKDKDAITMEAIPNDLEEAAKAAATEVYTYTFQGMDDLIGLFKAGAKWDRSQMMQEAVEGYVVKDITGSLAVTAKGINLDGFKFGDKVRVIVIPKEDWK